MSLLNRALPDVAGGSIVYSDGTNTVAIDATYGKTKYQVQTESSVVTAFTDRDFILSASALVLGGVATLPKSGHTITVVDGGERYQVLPPDGMQVYERSDPEGTTLRVHCKKIL